MSGLLAGFLPGDWPGGTRGGLCPYKSGKVYMETDYSRLDDLVVPNPYAIYHQTHRGPASHNEFYSYLTWASEFLTVLLYEPCEVTYFGHFCM
jgi:hypothetical protein